MNEKNKFIEKRKYPRIEWHFVIRFRLKDKPDAKWEASSIKDIGEGGCLFHGGQSYKVGDILEIKIQFPALKEPLHFTGEVKRCIPKSKEGLVYGTAVCFQDIDEKSKKAFCKTLNFFVKKK